MGRFSSRFSDDDDDDTRRPSKPDCYGDPDYYDITHQDCRACSFKGTCKLKVSALEREESRDRRKSRSRSEERGRSSGRMVRKKDLDLDREYEYEDANEEDTFFSVLAYNSTLNAATVMASTLTNSLGDLPRKRYRPKAQRKRRIED